MNVPEGNLIRRRVVTDLATPLANALDGSLTGYARLEPGETLLLDSDAAGIITFESGVPVVAYHAGTDNTGPDAVSDIAVADISRVELYELDGHHLAPIHEQSPDRVPPGLPAKQLADDESLVERTRERAPETRRLDEADDESLAAVEAFLEDSDRIDEIRTRARNQAAERATEWGFDLSET